MCSSVLCESVLCERVVGDAEVADRRRRDPTTEKPELHTMMWGITYLETNRIQHAIKQCVAICRRAASKIQVQIWYIICIYIYINIIKYL